MQEIDRITIEGTEELAMPNFEEISEARKVLRLGEAATLKEIRQAYRRMSFRHHPDTTSDRDKAQGEETMKKLNWAYKLLMEYCTHYKYSFTEEDVARTYHHDEYFRKYCHGWFEGI